MCIEDTRIGRTGKSNCSGRVTVALNEYATIFEPNQERTSLHLSTAWPGNTAFFGNIVIGRGTPNEFWIGWRAGGTAAVRIEDIGPAIWGKVEVWGMTDQTPVTGVEFMPEEALSESLRKGV